MEIEIPSALGEVLESNLSDESQNIIYGQDSHISSNSSLNLGLLYVHLAENYGLKVVSIETGGRKEFAKPLRLSIPDRTVERLKEENAGEDGYDLSDSGLMVVAARLLGHEIIFADSGVDGNVGSIWNSLRWFATLPMEERPSLQEEFNVALSSAILLLSEPTKGEVIQVVKDFYDNQDENAENRLRRSLGMIRTKSVISALTAEMELQNVRLALVCRGADHTQEFIDTAKKNQLGYLVFKPNGIEEKNNQWEEEYLKRRNEEAADFTT